jgi:hypothetical protein
MSRLEDGDGQVHHNLSYLDCKILRDFEFKMPRNIRGWSD